MNSINGFIDVFNNRDLGSFVAFTIIIVLISLIVVLLAFFSEDN